jgi:opacity protein-like surface antigen
MKTKALAIFSMIILLSLASYAQNSSKKLGIELNGGASFPLSELSHTKLNPGVGFEAIFHYRFIPHLGVYTGWGWNKLSADKSFSGDDVCFEETGYILGLQFIHPISNSSFSYYVRGGGVYKHIETENAEGDIINDTGHGLGFQAAGGIAYDFGKNWSLTTGARYNMLNRDADFEGVNRKLNYQYISVNLGIVKMF